jgi:hypothetical protein
MELQFNPTDTLTLTCARLDQRRFMAPVMARVRCSRDTCTLFAIVTERLRFVNQSLTPTVKMVHGSLELAPNHIGKTGFGFVERAPNPIFVILGGPRENVIHDLSPISRVIDTDPQAPEFPGAEHIDDISQSIVPGIPPSLFQTQGPDRQVELIVHDQYLLWCYIEIADYRDQRLPTSIHEGRRFEKPQVPPCDEEPADQAMKLVLHAKLTAVACGQELHEPVAHVMASGLILESWIA